MIQVILVIAFLIVAKVCKISDAELLVLSLFYCTFVIADKLNDVRVDIRYNPERFVELLESREGK